MAPNSNNQPTQSPAPAPAFAQAQAPLAVDAQVSPKANEQELSPEPKLEPKLELDKAKPSDQDMQAHANQQDELGKQGEPAQESAPKLAKVQASEAHAQDKAQVLSSSSSGNDPKTHSAYQDDEDDYGIPAKKISYEQALELSKQQQGLVSVISMLQVIVICVFMAGFIGYVKADGVIKELALTQDNIELQARLSELCGALVEQGSIGAALWFMLSSLVGGVALLIPIAIYNIIARSADRSGGTSAGVTLYDVIRAEILKYALMIIILALAFKFTSLNALVIMATFVIVMFSQIIKSALSLGRR